MQVSAYVLQRDNRTFQYCGATGPRPEIDHVFPRSHGGPNRTFNLLNATAPQQEVTHQYPKSTLPEPNT